MMNVDSVALGALRSTLNEARGRSAPSKRAGSGRTGCEEFPTTTAVSFRHNRLPLLKTVIGCPTVRLTSGATLRLLIRVLNRWTIVPKQKDQEAA